MLAVIFFVFVFVFVDGQSDVMIDAAGRDFLLVYEES